MNNLFWTARQLSQYFFVSQGKSNKVGTYYANMNQTKSWETAVKNEGNSLEQPIKV